jgi:hypothetical protein
MTVWRVEGTALDDRAGRLRNQAYVVPMVLIVPLLGSSAGAGAIHAAVPERDDLL